MWWIVAALLMQQQSDGIKALEEQRYAAAVEIFSRADPKDYSAQFHLGLAYSFLDKDVEAAAAYKKALELKPGLYEAELNLGMVLLRQKQAGDAAPYLLSAATQKPSSFRPVFYAGEALLASGQHEKAADLFSKAAAIDPSSASAELGWGRAIARRGDLAVAAPHFERAATLDPGFRDVRLELASLYEDRKQMAEAIAIYKQFPENSAAQERMGQLLMVSGQAGAAIPSLEASVKAAPTSANRYALATAYIREGQFGKAIPHLEQAVASEATNYDLRMTFARALQKEKRLGEAAQQFLKAAELKPDSAEPWSDLAGILMAVGKDPQSIAALDKVKALGGEKPGHHFFRAVILDRNQQYEPALASYEQFLALSNGVAEDEEFKARQRIRVIKKELSKR